MDVRSELTRGHVDSGAPWQRVRIPQSATSTGRVVTLLFTPFTDDGKRFDAASMRRQLDFVLASEVSAVVACGKAGEFEGQSLEEIEEVLAVVLEHVGGRVPVGMGIISVEEDRGVPAAELAARCGADFAMARKLTKGGLHGFFGQISERIPVMLYDQTDEGTLDVDEQVLPLVAGIEAHRGREGERQRLLLPASSRRPLPG